MKKPTLSGSSSGPDLSRIPSPMKGLCYQPAPTDYIGNQGQGQKYFDTDFYNTDFPGFWSTANNGRGDLSTMADLGINFIHLYDWNPQRDHGTFLTDCQTRGLAVAVPINNSFCTNLESWGANGIYQIMQEIYTLGGGSTPYTPVAMWTIANEYNQLGTGVPNAAQIAQVAQIILYAESQLNSTIALPISSPTSFAPADSPGIAPTQALQSAFTQTQQFSVTINGSSVDIPPLPSDFFETRYVAATNPQNPGSTPPASSGVTIQSWLPTFQAAFPNTPLWFSEIGIGVQNSCNGFGNSCQTGEVQQAIFTTNQLMNAEANAFLLGSCIYEYTPDYQNSPVTSNNYTFSLLNDNGGTTPATNFTIPATAPAGAGDTYPVQQLLTNKPVYAAVKALWNPAPITVQANQAWQKTGVFVPEGSTVTITYESSKWTADPHTNNGNLYDAAGCPGLLTTQKGYTMLNENMGCLCGFIGATPVGDGSDAAFLVADSCNQAASASGELWLCINDDLKHLYGSGLADNSGSVTVSITIS